MHIPSISLCNIWKPIPLLPLSPTCSMRVLECVMKLIGAFKSFNFFPSLGMIVPSSRNCVGIQPAVQTVIGRWLGSKNRVWITHETAVKQPFWGYTTFFRRKKSSYWYLLLTYPMISPEKCSIIVSQIYPNYVI